MSEHLLEANITGVSLASLLTGLPKVNIPRSALSSLPASPLAGERQSVWGGLSNGLLHPLSGDSEGLLFGRVLSVPVDPAMQDMASKGSGPSILGSSGSQGAGEGQEVNQVVQRLTVERHWEVTSLDSEGCRQRLFDGAGAVQSEVLQHALRLASGSGAEDIVPHGSAQSSAFDGLGEGLGPAAAEQLDQVVGWFVRKRTSPPLLRPSMRETGATVALQRWVSQRLPQSAHRPLVLLLITGNEGSGAAGTVHTCSYRLFVFTPKRELAKGGEMAGDGKLHGQGGAQHRGQNVPLRPLRLHVLNLGNSTRPQYNPLGCIPMFLAQGHTGKGKGVGSQSKTGEDAEFVLVRLADQAWQQAAQVEGAYQQQVQQLQHFALELSFLESQGR